jgi:hypothetical protein
VTRVRDLKKPLSFYEDYSAFKIYMVDLGLLGAMAQTDPADILTRNNGFMEYKGAFTEQYVAQQIMAVAQKKLYYYSRDDSRLEIDFTYQANRVCAIEVRAKVNLRSKRLKSVLMDYSDVTGMRISMSGYRKEERLYNVPLYLVEPWLQKLDAKGI